jgi:hypothetical protein
MREQEWPDMMSWNVVWVFWSWASVMPSFTMVAVGEVDAAAPVDEDP